MVNPSNGGLLHIPQCVLQASNKASPQANAPRLTRKPRKKQRKQLPKAQKTPRSVRTGRFFLTKLHVNYVMSLEQANVPNDDKGLDPPPPKDEDPTGIKALGAADGLEQAWKLVSPLLPELAGRIDVLICAYDLSVRRSQSMPLALQLITMHILTRTIILAEKFLQAVKMLLTAQAVDAQDPELHVRIVDFKLHSTNPTFSYFDSYMLNLDLILEYLVSPSPSQVPESVQSVIALALPKLIPEGMGLDAFNSQFLQRQGTSPKVVLAVAQVSRKLGAPADETESIVFGLLNPELQSDVKVRSGSADDCRFTDRYFYFFF